MFVIVPYFWWVVFGIGLVVSVAIGVMGGLISAWRAQEKRDGKR